MASDGVNTYSRGVDGGLVGIGNGTPGSGVLAYTDQHDDVVGNFTATGSTLTGSATYDPLGNVSASSGQVGHLGYQSGWTEQSTGKVDMGSRWYNPAIGQFQNRDTLALNPVPDSVTANPFAYVDDDPMVGTDPDGHCWSGFGWACKAAHHYVAPAINYVRNHYIAPAGNWTYRNIARPVIHHARTVVHHVRDVYHRVVRVYHSVVRHVRRYVHHAWHAVRTVYHRVRHAVRHVARTVVHAVKRVAKTVATVARSAAKASVTFVKHHAATIAGLAAGTLAFAGCEALTGGLGTVGCAAVAGAVGNAVSYGVKAAQTGKFSWSGLGMAALTGAATGALGGVAGVAGGRLLSAVGSRLLGVAGSRLAGEGAGLLADGVTEAADSAGEELAVGEGAGGGGEGGGGGGGGGDGGGPRGRAGTESRSGGTCHSFTGGTQVLMADGSSKPISWVRVGDKITNGVPGTGKLQVHAVTKVIVTRTDHDFVDLTIAAEHPHHSVRSGHAGHGRGRLTATATASDTVISVGTITTTFHHPFYDITKAAFVDAQHLQPGDRLQQPGGVTATVLDIHAYHATHTTYDLTIGALHTYYVEAGDTPVLVHNCGETYYRSMSNEHYAELQATGRLPSTSETFISPTQGFSESYEGTLVKFTLRPGTTAKLEGVGVRDGSAITQGTYPNMPGVSSGWTRTSAFFKGEGDQVNIGLGRGTALDIFNGGILDFGEIPR